ncbi:hypothetical protein FRB98_004252, partial [Tulasnella sp. 332]
REPFKLSLLQKLPAYDFIARSANRWITAGTIPYPSDPAAVASASRRARVLWSERDAAMIDATTERLTLRSRSNSIDSSCAATAIATEQPKNDGPTDMSDHLTKCNGCNE